jgi:two-component sensor histidine kinase
MSPIAVARHHRDRRRRRKGRSAEEYRYAFLGRLEALVWAEDIPLSEDANADLGVIIRQSVKPAGPDRTCIEVGEPLSLKKGQVVPLSLILHELATNAFKYGAWSTAQGIVHVGWQVTTEAGQQTLKLHWSEEGGPPLTPPEKSGFGMRLIQYSASQSLGGATELVFKPTGLEVFVTTPLA